MPEAIRDGLSKSVYGRGPLAFAGGSNISADAAISGVPYKPGCVRPAAVLDRDAAGSRFLVATGVPGIDDTELPDRILSIKSPPLPELTVICGGRFGAPEAPSVGDILFEKEI